MIHVPMRVSGRTCWRIISIAWIASCTPFTALMPFQGSPAAWAGLPWYLARKQSSAKNCELGRVSSPSRWTMMAKSYSLNTPALHMSTLQPIASSSGVPIISMSMLKATPSSCILCSVNAANTLIEPLAE